MKKLTVLSDYIDDQGNSISSPTTFDKNIAISIRGSNNRIIVDRGARITKLTVIFDCDNGTVIIGPSRRRGFSMSMQLGQDSTVRVGADVTTTGACIINAAEGSTVTFGNDVMIASGNQFRAHDGHPIFDVTTGKRVNPVKDITIGNHVWFGAQAIALAGANVGDGSVIGFRSIVNKKIPNNCVAVGSPAKVVRKNIAWERPHLSFVAPPYKPDSSTVEKSEEYWNLTEEPIQVLSPAEGIIFNIRRRARHVRRRLLNIRRQAWHVRRRLLNK